MFSSKAYLSSHERLKGQPEANLLLSLRECWAIIVALSSILEVIRSPHIVCTISTNQSSLFPVGFTGIYTKLMVFQSRVKSE